jgi:transposase
MSSALLYPAFGVRHYRCQRISQSGGVITLHLRQDASRDRCSACQSANVIRRGSEERTIRTVPLGGKPVDLRLPVPRLGCRDCGVVRQAVIRLAKPLSRVTHAFERYAIGLLSHMTIQAVADHLQVGWDRIKALFKRRLESQFGQPKLKHVTRLAIDEISIGHGHHYLTVVLDLKSGAVLFVGEGKGADALIPFWKRLKHAHAKIEAVATDMSPAYTFAVHEHLPNALHVFDHFHIVKLLNDRLSDFRRELQRQAEGPLGQEVLKGTRWLILKNPENLSDEKGNGKYRTTSERERLEMALRINQPLATPAMKKAMQETMNLRWNLAKTQREIGELQRQLNTLVTDQGRLRENIKATPSTAAVYKKYLKKLDDQEEQIEKYQEDIKKLQKAEHEQKKSFDDFLANFNAE